jgi:hypothetical protein
VVIECDENICLELRKSFELYLLLKNPFIVGSAIIESAGNIWLEWSNSFG